MSGETLIQQASRHSEREFRNRQGMSGPFEGLVVEVVNREDSLSVSYGPTQGRKMPIQHPFVGAASWIRSIPDVGTRVLMQNRFDTGQAEILKALPIGPFDRASSYLQQQSTYRELNPGEHDLASQGFASIYMSRRGTIDQYAGTGVDRRMNRDNLDIQDSAPTLRSQYLNWTPGAMGDEKRTGIVKRWNTAVDEKFIQDSGGNFQNENYFHLKNPAGQNPAVLLRRIEGQVYDDTGKLLKQFSTQNNLRHQSFLYTDTDDFLRYEVDVQGNTLEIFPSVATTGKEIRIPNGSYTAQIGLDRDVTIDRDEKVIVSQNIQYTVGNDVKYTVTNDFLIEAGENLFTMSNTPASEEVNLLMKASAIPLGFQAQNTGDGGLTQVFGPMSSLLEMTGDGQVTLKDGLGASLVLDGPTATLTTSTGTSIEVGASLTAKLGSGADSVTMSPGLMEIMTSGSFMVNAAMIFLGEGAAIPAVLGLTLIQYLDSHTHTGNLGFPTSPPTISSSSFIGTPLSIVSVTCFLAPAI